MKRFIFILIIAFAGKAFSQEVPALETYTLKNGLKIYLMAYGKIPAVNVRFVINTGEKNEAPGQQGYCGITANMILCGNTKYTQEQQNDIAFKLGGTLSGSDNKDNTTVSADFLTKDFDLGMDLFSSAILHPLFNKDKLDQEISQTIDYNNPSKMDISDLTDIYSDYALYGTASPLGRNYYKTQLKLITPEKIREFYLFNFTPKNSSVVICGNFNSADVKIIIEKYFGAWQSTYGEVNGVSLDFPQIKKKEIGFINRKGATQCNLRWNKIAPSVKDKDFLAFTAANQIFNRTLFKEIREKGGKTYGIGSAHRPSQFSNLFEVSCSVRSEEMTNTMNLFDVTIKNFNTGVLTQEDFEIAITAMKVRAMSSEMPGSISTIYNPLIFDFNKRKNYLNDVAVLKMEDVQKVIKKYFTPDTYKLVLAGDESTSIVNDQLNAIKGLVRYSVTDLEKDN